MTLKNPNRFNKEPQLQQSIDRLYETRVESLFKNVSGTATSYLYQSIETGEASFSATGSATVTKNFAFAEKKGTIIFATANVKSTLVTAHVTDVTGTSITVECRTISGTANFSAVTTASLVVGYLVLSSNP